MTTSNREPQWRTANRCSAGGCVTVAYQDGNILVADTKNADGPPLVFTRAEWADFIAGVEAGDFDPATLGGDL